MNLQEKLHWRYATQAFDPEKTIPESDIDEIIDIFRMAPSAFGIQPWKLIVVQNKDIQKELLPVSYNQQKIADASALLVIAYVKNTPAELGMSHIENVAKTTGTPLEMLEWYKNSTVNFLTNTPADKKDTWAKNQAYLAAGFLLAHLAEKQIDSCGMEGFSPADYDRILQLDKYNCASAMVIPIGYRLNDPLAQAPKVRFPAEEISVKIK